MLVAVYGIFAVAATSRSAVQLATRFDQAPVAYLLSAFAAVVYVLADLVVPQAFPDATVWSFFGIGYGFVPLVLPVLGLLWLRRTA